MARHLSPQDVVPRLRPDLSFDSPPSGVGAEVIRIGPAGTNERFALHGFEFSIALMLDGKRTVAEVVRACERLGLPVELEALEGFFEQLKSYGLVSSGKAPPSARTRKTWSPAVRALFRAALREARTGRPAEARADLEQLLAMAPQTEEAVALRRWLDAHPAAAPDGATFEQLVRAVEDRWLDDRRPAWHELVGSAIHRSRWPFAALAAVLAVLVIVMLVPLPRVVSASARLTPVTELPVFSPASGLVDEVLVREGDRVEAGDVLFTWDASELDLRLFKASRRLEAARAPLREAAGRTVAGQPWWLWLVEAEGDEAAARAALVRELDVADGEVRGAEVQRLTEELADAQTRADLARAALDSMPGPEESPEALRAAARQLELAALEQQRAQLEVRASRAGVVKRLNVVPGHPLPEHQTVAELEDTSRLKMVAVTTTRQAASMEPGEHATFRFGSVRVAADIEAISAYEVAAELDNSTGALKPGSGPVDIELAPRSIFQRLTR